MNEDELRALVRDAVARHLGGPAQTPSGAPVRTTVLTHPSHYRFTSLPKSDGPCIIEPTVTCNHCGYCESHGH